MTYLDNILNEINIKLSEEQKNVVIEEKDTIVIACAGSGKTTTMVAKVKYLIEKKGIKNSEILLISYTNKATQELETIINRKLNLKIKILTFHKLGLQLLDEKHKIIDTKEIVEKIINKFKKETKWKLFLNYIKRKQHISLYHLKEISTTFIIHYKASKIEINKMKVTILWKKYLNELINEYESIMKKNNFIDFEDMIITATENVKNKNIEFAYKYIIVDEYQDISEDRFKLLYILKNKYKSTLVVVGDDWQSIFAFTGSQISLFIQFKKYFPQAKLYKITTTFRNSKQLNEIAGSFIMKNNYQIKKELNSPKTLEKPLVLVPWINNKSKKLLNILKIISEKKDKSHIFLLGRYNSDFKIENYDFLKLENNKIICKEYPNLEIEFLTVHSSKGLGADEVILLNCNKGTYGFPSMKKSNYIIKQIIKEDKTYKYGEERRLFYVALTRTKNHIFIMYNQRNKSIFVKEIEKEFKKYIRKI